jgi:hypothetical protein
LSEESKWSAWSSCDTAERKVSQGNFNLAHETQSKRTVEGEVVAVTHGLASAGRDAGEEAVLASRLKSACTSIDPPGPSLVDAGAVLNGWSKALSGVGQSVEAVGSDKTVDHSDAPRMVGWEGKVDSKALPLGCECKGNLGELVSYWDHGGDGSTAVKDGSTTAGDGSTTVGARLSADNAPLASSRVGEMSS